MVSRHRLNFKAASCFLNHSKYQRWMANSDDREIYYLVCWGLTPQHLSVYIKYIYIGIGYNGSVVACCGHASPKWAVWYRHGHYFICKHEANPAHKRGENPVHSDGEKSVHKRLLAQLPALLPVSKAKTGPEFYSPTGRCYLCAAEGYP